MAGDTEDPELAAEQLEAALERLAAAALRAQARAEAAAEAAAAQLAAAQQALARAEAMAEAAMAEAEAAMQAGAAAASGEFLTEDSDPDDPGSSGQSPASGHAMLPDPAEAAALIGELDAIIARLRSALGTGD